MKQLRNPHFREPCSQFRESLLSEIIPPDSQFFHCFHFLFLEGTLNQRILLIFGLHIPLKLRFLYRKISGFRCVHTYHNQPSHPSGNLSCTYVRFEIPQTPFIWGLATASIPKDPHTRRPAELVTLLQYSRLYLLWLAMTASLKLRRFKAVRLFSSHHIL